MSWSLNRLALFSAGTTARWRRRTARKLLRGFFHATLFLSATAGAAWSADLLVSVGTQQSTSGTIYSYSPTGGQSVYASGFTNPFGMAFDASGNLFVADTGSGSLVEVAPDGSRTVIVPALTTSDSVGLAFGSNGELYASDEDGHIYEYSSTGQRSTFATFSLGNFSPAGIGFAPNGNLILANNGANVYSIAPNGTESVFSPIFPGAFGVAFDAQGDLFISNSAGNNINEFSAAGVHSIFVSGLSRPEGLAFDAQGNLYEVDNGSGNIYEFTAQGVRTTFTSGLPTGLDGAHFLTFAAPEPATWVLLMLGIGTAAGVTAAQRSRSARRLA